MGYTRYYTTDKNLDHFPADFQDDAAAIIRTAHEQGIEISGPLGDGAPEVSVRRVLFNGPVESVDGDDLSYETFAIDLNSSLDYLNGSQDWGFCKTGCQPYDIVVNAILQSAKYHGVVSSYSADGDNEEDAATELLAAAGCGQRAA